MILKPRYVGRFREVTAVLIRHGFADVLVELDLQRFLPGREHARTTPEQKEQHRARSLRLALEELGAAYVKLGQLLSTRPDLLPAAYLSELEQLQNRVGPFSPAAARATIEAELGGPLAEHFDAFEDPPFASASLSQVHRARLRAAADGQPAGLTVAIKVLRPEVEREVNLDLEILAEVADMVARSALGRRIDAVGLVTQLEQTLRDELDLTREARNYDHFREALAGFPRLRVPRVLHELSTRRVFVSEFVAGSAITGANLPEGAGAELAEQLWRGYLKEILVDGLFQCDPHPGNFLIDADSRIVLLDHGMVAHLGRDAQLRLLGLLLALADQDGERVAESCVEIGEPGAAFNERRFRGEVSQLVPRHAARPLGGLELGGVFADLLRAAFRNDIQIPPSLMMLGKTLLNLEGVCRALHPGLEPVAIMRKVAGELLVETLGRDLTRERALAVALETRAIASEVPASVRRILRRAASNDFRVGLRLEGADDLKAAIHKIASRITLGLITAALIIGSALLLNIRAGWMLAGYPVFALIGFLLAAGLGIYLVVKIIVVDKY